MNIKRVAIYLRLSNEDRNKNDINDDSESIKNQRNLLLSEINKNENYILFDEYCDEDLSGAGTYRPEFERLIKDCENGKIDIVLCKSQSRFSRDMEIIEKYLHNKFAEWNVRFIGIADNTDTDNMGNKKARQINGLVNEWFLEDISNNIRSAFKAKMKQGEFISPFAPFGYEISNIDNNKLVIDYEAAKIVKEIFNLYLNGYSLTGIVNYLNERKIPSPSLYKYQKGIKLNIVSNKKKEEIIWNIKSIKNILTNEIYIGNLIQGKRTTISYKNHKIKIKDKCEWIRCENTHEKIIDNETFYKVQNLIKVRRRATKTKRIHLLSGKCFCNECKKIMRKKNSNIHEYLVCSNKSCSNKKSIRYDSLSSVILKEINKLIKKYYDKNYIDNIKEKEDIGNDLIVFNKRKEKIKADVLKIEEYLINLYEDKINKIISELQFKNYNEFYLKKINLLNKEINEIDNEINAYNNKTQINIDNKLKELNTFIVNEFINRIYIGSFINEERTIKIEWNLKNNL